MTQAATLAALASSGAIATDSSGNVGIGTTTPSAKLHVAGGAESTIRNTASSGSSWFVGTNSSSYILHNESNTPMVFTTNGTERVRIDASGNFIVATGGSSITAGGGTPRFSMNYSSNTGPGYTIQDTNPQNGNTFIRFVNAGTVGGAITSNGGTTMTYGSASDYRLKENLTPLTGALAKVAALQPKAGNWKADGSEFIGFVAHELQEVFPDSVVGEKDKTDDGGNPQYQMVDAGSAAIIATLTAAIQELKAEVDQLRAQLEAK